MTTSQCVTELRTTAKSFEFIALEASRINWERLLYLKYTRQEKYLFLLRDKLKEELYEMEKIEVVKKIYETTKCVNPIVVVSKPTGSPRICLDQQDLNSVIKREQYQLSTLDEITSKLANAT